MGKGIESKTFGEDENFLKMRLMWLQLSLVEERIDGVTVDIMFVEECVSDEFRSFMKLPADCELRTDQIRQCKWIAATILDYVDSLVYGRYAAYYTLKDKIEAEG